MAINRPKTSWKTNNRDAISNSHSDLSETKNTNAKPTTFNAHVRKKSENRMWLFFKQSMNCEVKMVRKGRCNDAIIEVKRKREVRITTISKNIPITKRSVPVSAGKMIHLMIPNESNPPGSATTIKATAYLHSLIKNCFALPFPS